VAFSGGPDSSTLLHLLHTWCANNPEETPALVAIHVNHAIQSSADSWQAHCEGVCDRLGIPLIVHQAVVESSGQGVEAAARQARYDFFEAELKGGDLLFMGHHLDDQVETYFLRLLRGSGLSGLSAMPARRPLGEGELIRPLLTIERSVLEAYVDNHGLSVVQDPSNSDTSLDRNYLRQQVLPLLADRWPGYRQTVVRAADQAGISQAVLDECLPVPRTVLSVMGDPGVELRDLSSVSFEAALIKLRRWLRHGGYPMPDRQVLVEFMRQLREGAAASSPRLECSSYILQRYQQRVYLLPNFVDDLTDSPVALLPGGESRVAGVGEFHLQRAEGAGFRLAQSDYLELRWRAGGERCRPEGRPYNQRLKKLFQEFEVPPWWRERVPLLYLGDELLAVGGLFQCESSRLQPEGAVGEDLWQLRWTRKPCAFD
jgi:tRNA(Ile)-lysidine synthase